MKFINHESSARRFAFIAKKCYTATMVCNPKPGAEDWQPGARLADCRRRALLCRAAPRSGIALEAVGALAGMAMAVFLLPMPQAEAAYTPIPSGAAANYGILSSRAGSVKDTMPTTSGGDPNVAASSHNQSYNSDDANVETDSVGYDVTRLTTDPDVLGTLSSPSVGRETTAATSTTETTVADPLRGYCSSVGTTSECQDNNTNSLMPENPITGFVYQVNLRTTNLQGSSHSNNSLLLNITQNLPLGSYIVAYLNTGTERRPDWIATANSGAILKTHKVAEPGALALLASGLGLFGMVVWRCRRREPAAQVSP